LLDLDDAARLEHPYIGADRALLIIAGAAIMSTVMRLWPIERMRVADRGLREGLLYALLGETAGSASPAVRPPSSRP
jgi:exopolyphosphatase/guanosine-5'-triphosphate,3'-diphosphate pyrophosphatase